MILSKNENKKNQCKANILTLFFQKSINLYILTFLNPFLFDAILKKANSKTKEKHLMDVYSQKYSSSVQS